VARRARSATVTAMMLKEEPEGSGFAVGGASWDPGWRSKSPLSKDW